MVDPGIPKWDMNGYVAMSRPGQPEAGIAGAPAAPEMLIAPPAPTAPPTPAGGWVSMYVHASPRSTHVCQRLRSQSSVDDEPWASHNEQANAVVVAADNTNARRADRVMGLQIPRTSAARPLHDRAPLSLHSHGAFAARHTMTIPQLYGTPLSHFTRKVRVLLAELDVPFEFVRTPGVLAPPGAAYGHNPLARVPTLVDGQVTVIDSDNIARYLVAKFDPADRLAVRSERVDDLNRLAVINGLMGNEVVLILAERGGVENVDDIVYFRKLRAAIDAGLTWLDDETQRTDAMLDYPDVASICLWDHLTHYGLGADPARYPRLAQRVALFRDRPSMALTAPEASLRDATAAGWRPA